MENKVSVTTEMPYLERLPMAFKSHWDQGAVSLKKRCHLTSVGNCIMEIWWLLYSWNFLYCQEGIYVWKLKSLLKTESFNNANFVIICTSGYHMLVSWQLSVFSAAFNSSIKIIAFLIGNSIGSGKFLLRQWYFPIDSARISYWSNETERLLHWLPSHYQKNDCQIDDPQCLQWWPDSVIFHPTLFSQMVLKNV